MMIGQVNGLENIEEENKCGRVSSYGGIYHYEFSIISSKDRYSSNRDYLLDLASTLPITLEYRERRGYSIPQSEMNYLGDF